MSDTDLTVLADRLLTRTADAVFVLDDRTGRAAERWYDRTSSKLDLPEEPGSQVMVTWVHPDDLPEVLESYSSVVHGADSSTTFARIDPARGMDPGTTMLLVFRRIDDLWAHGVLVQVWIVTSDSAVSPNADAATSLSSLAAAAPIGLQVISAAGRVSFENQRFTELASDAREPIATLVDMGLQTGATLAEDVATAGGRSLRLRVVPTLDDHERPVMAVASLEDVTREREAEEGRALAEQQFEALFQSSPIATALVSLDGSFARANEAFGIVTGYEVDQLVGMRFQEITHPDDVDADLDLLAELLSGARSSYQMEKRYRHAGGHDVWVDLTVAPVRDSDGAVQHLIAHVEDITARRSLLEQEDSSEVLEYWATHDHLTALPNRRYLERELTVALATCRRRSDRPLVVFMDLDDFKPVNDRLGHQAGDEVLRTTARRLRSASRHGDTVARYGGDEFVVVASGLRNPAELALVVDRIHSAIQAPIDIDGTTVRIGASLGIAVGREDDSVAELLGRADAAAYRAKARGKNAVEVDATVVL